MKRIALAVMTVCLFCVVSTAADLDQRVKHEYADSGGVKIHYATLGPKKMPATGVAPLIVMIHGFPISGTPGAIKWKLSRRPARWPPSTSAATT